MRIGFACLLVGAGCNSIFGTNSVNELYTDAGPPADASPYSMQITGMAFNSAKLDPTMVAPTFPVLPSVTVQIGAMPAATAGAFPDLEAAPVDATGTFLVPFALTLADYRVVYQAPDGIPVEYQTSLHTPHHFIANVDLGRPARVIPAADAALAPFFPATPPSAYVNARLIETGAWAVIDLGAADPSSTEIKWSETIASTSGTTVTSQLGALTSPETQKGDSLLLVDASDGKTANAYSVFTLEGFNGATPNGLAGTAWKTNGALTSAKFTAVPPNPPTLTQRVYTATRSNSVSDDDHQVATVSTPQYWSGVIPSTALPNFVASGAGGPATPLAQKNGVGGMDLPTFAFMSTADGVSDLPYVDVFDGTIAPQFPQAIFARLSRSRTTFGVSVSEGLQTIMPTKSGPPVIDLSIGIAFLAGSHMTFGGMDIWNNLDTPWPVHYTTGQPLLPFSFGVDGPVDDCVTTLYKATSTAYVPVRRYLMPSNSGHGAPPGVLVDATTLTAGQSYVFGVACHRGYPSAAVGDWSVVTYPFSESVLYSFPFVVVSP